MIEVQTEILQTDVDQHISIIERTTEIHRSMYQRVTLAIASYIKEVHLGQLTGIHSKSSRQVSFI